MIKIKVIAILSLLVFVSYGCKLQSDMKININYLGLNSQKTSATVEISNNGMTKLNWRAASDNTTVSVSPDSGSVGPGQ